MFVKPVAGRLVPLPVGGGFLPETGADVPEEQYWFRRINDGDVEQVEPAPAAATKRRGGE